MSDAREPVDEKQGAAKKAAPSKDRMQDLKAHMKEFMEATPEEHAT